MAVGKCEECGVEEYMPYVCKFCKGRYCASHRLPENHGCRGLDAYRERARSEGRIFMPEQPDVMRPQVSRSQEWKERVGSYVDRMNGKAAQVALGVIGAMFVLQMIVVALDLPGVYRALFVLDAQVYLKPWTLFTSIFAHGDLNHFLVNAIVLYFFGPTVERLIGTRRFVALFLGAGALAGLVQVGVFNVALPLIDPARFGPLAAGGVLGASGAIYALFGLLTVLAPRLKVLLFFVVPVPIWALTIGYAALDLLRIFDLSSNVAGLAHLTGLAVGLAYGKKLHNEGLRVRVSAPQSGPQYGRYF